LRPSSTSAISTLSLHDALPISERLALRAPEVFDELGVRTVLGSPAEKLDARVREVLLADGERVGYDVLVAATGVRARTVPGVDRSEEHTSELQSRENLVCRLLL